MKAWNWVMGAVVFVLLCVHGGTKIMYAKDMADMESEMDGLIEQSDELRGEVLLWRTTAIQLCIENTMYRYGQSRAARLIADGELDCIPVEPSGEK